MSSQLLCCRKAIAKFSQSVAVNSQICARFRECLHETGMKSDRDEFRSVPIKILLSDYMRPVRKLNSDRDDSFRLIDRNENLRPGQLWTGTTCNRKNVQTGLSFCAHGALRQRSGSRKSLQCSQNGGRKAGKVLKNITHAVAETNITKHISCN